MTAALWLGIEIFTFGLAVRIWASRRFTEAYRDRHGAGPLPRGWLWTASADREVERWRRYSLLGTSFLWVGAIVAILNPAM
ncbi:MAG TPA: hypothetical protein VNL94_06960 [Candidatus Binatia bacterium]|nr:hypothetical protein [Candidatus Binatia bacterium]